jgi:hypothetical protein
MSAAIQFAGAPNPEKRPWTMTKPPSATMRPGSYFQRRREALDEVEEALAAGCDVRAVLDVVGRPEPLGGCVVAPVEQRIEGLKHECFILLLYRLTHSFGPPSTGMLATGSREQLPPNLSLSRSAYHGSPVRPSGSLGASSSI